MSKRLVVGISGASGAPIAVALLKALRETDYETHLIISRGGEQTILAETCCSVGMPATVFMLHGTIIIPSV